MKSGVKPPNSVIFYDRVFISVSILLVAVHIAGGISFSGIALYDTGCAQVRFLLACQPRTDYLLPVNGSRGSNKLN